MAVQNKGEIWLIGQNDNGIERVAKVADNANWGMDRFSAKIFFRDPHHPWTTVSSKGDTAEVALSPEYFGLNRLMINERSVSQEKGIVWVFSPYAPPLIWAPDGERLYSISAESGWSKFYSIDRAGSDRRQETFGAGDDRDLTVLSDGTIIFISNRSSRVEWSIWMKKAGGEPSLLYGQNGLIKDLSISPDEKWIAFQSSTATSPFDIYALNRGTGKVFQVTRNGGPELRRKAPTHEVVTYASNDRRIEGILYKPKNLGPSGKYPAIIRLHGGPSMQDTLTWNRTDQYLASRGYVVLAINYTGSTGYGKGHEEDNFFRIGQDDCDDVAQAAAYLKTLPCVGDGRIGVMGSSYGGYLANLVIGRYPGLFSAAVSWFGISDWLTIFDFPRLHPFVRFFFWNRLGDSAEHSELYTKASPLTYADSIRTPLLLVHGDADIVVPIQQSEILYDRMKRSGKDVELITYKGEGHGWARKETRDDAYRRAAEWFDKHLRPTKRSHL